MKKQPNILFIMSDDHGANAISAYQSRLSSIFKTPNLDRIANEGARFNNAYCTNAICTPSRATILTGKHSHTNGVRTLSDELDVSLETYPKMMQENGYQTAVFGKWHVHSEPQGFDHYEVLPCQGYYFDPYFLDSSCDWSTVGKFDHEVGKQHKGYVTDIITDKCMDWLKQRDEDKPFMLMCHHKAPHDDFLYHPRYEHLFDDIEIPEPESLWEDKGHRSIGSREYGTTVSEKNPRRNAVKHMSQPDYPTGQLDIEGLDARERTKVAYQKYLKDYLRVVKGIDDNVGTILDYLDKEGLAEDTIVIYTSDQGMFLGEHDYIDKRWIYEEALQMPFLIRYPKEVKEKTIVNELVSNVDFAPTLLDYASISPASGMQGKSFRPLAKKSGLTEWPNQIYYRYWMHMAHHDNPAHYGMRTKDYKLIFFYGLPLDAAGALPEPTPAGWELYDLKKDPNELKNVYEEPDYADVVEQLKKQLFELKKEVGDEDQKYPEVLMRLTETEKVSR